MPSIPYQCALKKDRYEQTLSRFLIDSPAEYSKRPPTFFTASDTLLLRYGIQTFVAVRAKKKLQEGARKWRRDSTSRLVSVFMFRKQQELDLVSWCVQIL